MEEFGGLCQGLTDEMHKGASLLSEAQEDVENASKQPKDPYFPA